MKNLEGNLSPFKATSSIHGNVVLNFLKSPENEFSAYADAFHDAAKILAKKIKPKKGYSDLDACPIVFLYRHSLELFFKAILITGHNIFFLKRKSLPITKEDIYSTHSLLRLLPSVKIIIEEVGWSWDLGINGFKKYEHFKEFIKSIDIIDPKSFAFRYPVNKKGKSHLPKHFIFNVIIFGKNMDRILELLSGATLGLNEMFQAAAESYYENIDY